MKVWLLTHESYGYAEVYSEDTNMLETRTVKDELDVLRDGYEDEYDEFVASYESAKRLGRGTARVEERFAIELVEVK